MREFLTAQQCEGVNGRRVELELAFRSVPNGSYQTSAVN